MSMPCRVLALALLAACAGRDEVIIDGYHFRTTADSLAQAMDDARDTFSRANSCPDDRIAIAPRPDIQWRREPTKPLPAGSVPMRPSWIPPDDIAADPGRLEVWQSTHWAELQVHQMELGRLRMQSSFVAAEGCGVRTVYFCRPLWKHPERASCETPPAGDLEPAR